MDLGYVAMEQEPLPSGVVVEPAEIVGLRRQLGQLEQLVDELLVEPLAAELPRRDWPRSAVVEITVSAVVVAHAAPLPAERTWR